MKQPNYPKQPFVPGKMTIPSWSLTHAPASELKKRGFRTEGVR